MRILLMHHHFFPITCPDLIPLSSLKSSGLPGDTT